MTSELVKAVNAMLTCMDRDDYAKCVINLGDARDAYVAEIRKRRSESPWRLPLDVEFSQSFGGWFVRTADKMVMQSLIAKSHAEKYRDALNSYYGYTASGEDILEGL